MVIIVVNKVTYQVLILIQDKRYHVRKNHYKRELKLKRKRSNRFDLRMNLKKYINYNLI